MPKLPRWTAAEAERALLKAGFDHLRSKGSHRIYGYRNLRVTVLAHSGATLHPKIVKQVVEAIEDAAKLSRSQNIPI